MSILGRHIFDTKAQKSLKKSLKNIIGFTPHYLTYYEIAITHRSKNESMIHNNERLEYLGDAIIGAIIGEYLFKKYPNKSEGYLTEMRSKIVSRQSLNSIAKKMGLQKLVRYNSQDVALRHSQIFGNALEALVGAIYLDVGYEKTKKFIHKILIGNFVDIDELEDKEYNFKNKLYTWAQRNGKELSYETVNESRQAGRKVFEVAIFLDKKQWITAKGYTKKEAGQRASEEALILVDRENSD